MRLRVEPLMGLSEWQTRDVEEEFDNGADLSEGVSGRVEINTEYENNLPPGTVHPRTQRTGEHDE